jgi:cation diffusion facilitator CzcD-associated flavoprotein CzcO
MTLTAPQKYHPLLLPTYPLGSKRRVFDTEYLSSLHRENMLLTDDPITQVLEKGVLGKSGRVYPADVIILANGFQTQNFVQPVRIVNGSRGLSLDDDVTGVWKEITEAYLGRILSLVFIIPCIKILCVLTLLCSLYWVLRRIYVFSLLY